MLEVIQDVVVICMAHYMAGDYMCSIILQHIQVNDIGL